MVNCRPVTVLLRFIFGVILAASVLVWVGLPSPFEVVFVLGAGVVAAMWGDRFILGFMSLLRYLR